MSNAAQSYNITEMIDPPKKGTPLWHTLIILFILMMPTFACGLLVGWIIFR